MKRTIFLMFVAVLTMTSCSIVSKTASTRDVTAPLAAAVISDLEVSNQKITYTLVPTNAIRRGGKKTASMPLSAELSQAMATATC